MKLLLPNPDRKRTPPSREPNRPAAKTRSRLSRKVSVMLAGVREARLPGHSWLAGLGSTAADDRADRLREVLSRDRALAAVQPPTRMAAATVREVETEAEALAVAVTETEAVAVTEAESAAVTEAESATEAESVAVTETVAVTEAAAVTETEPVSVSDTFDAHGAYGTEIVSASVATEAVSPSAAIAHEAASATSTATANPAVNEERPQIVAHEPIRTLTMARLLAAQGYRQRALAIYAELLARPGAQDALRAEAAALRARSS